MSKRWAVAGVLCLLWACGGDDSPDSEPPPDSGSDDDGSAPEPGEPEDDTRYEEDGPFGVGNITLSTTDESRNRPLTVEVWYPTDDTDRGGASVAEFMADEARRATYNQLLAAAPAECPSGETRSSRGASAASGGPWPLLVFSHCHNCVRFSSFSIAERLASHGFVVAAPDHTQNTLFDDLAGEGAPLDAEFLQVRGRDIQFVIDTMLAGATADLEIDDAKIGVYGHSFGAVTTGLVLQDDPRPAAGLGLASPFENPLLPGVSIDSIDKPFGFLVAVEDNSITEFGNVLIRRNFDNARVPAWKGEVADAGHWSFSDICGLTGQFQAGCGDADRQTNNQPFSYLPVERGIAIGQAYVTAFFAARLLGDEGAARYLERPDRFTEVSVDTRNAN